MPIGIYERTPEHNAALSKAMKNSKAAKAAAKAKTGVPLTPEHCASLSDASLGVSKSPEHCAAISAGTLGMSKSPPHL